MAESIIALVGIAIVTACASLLLVQSAGATTDVLTTTTSVAGDQEAASSHVWKRYNGTIFWMMWP